MSSVAKCLVLAGVALEADALLLQTGTTVTECKQHGCSGDSKDSGNDICKLYTKVADMTDEQKTALKDEKVEKGTKKDTVKFDGVEYTCAKADCAQDKKKPDDKKSTEPKDVDAKLGKEFVKKACDASNADAPKPDTETKAPLTQCDLLKAIKGAKSANDISAVEAKTGGDKKTITVTIKSTPNDYTCEDATQCTKATGEKGAETVTTADNVTAAKESKKATNELAEKIKTECEK